MEEKLGIIVPTRNRSQYVRELIDSLISSEDSNLLEINIFVDGDIDSLHDISGHINKRRDTCPEIVFNIACSEYQLYSVGAYNAALNLCSTNLFCWVSDLIVFEDKKWILNLLNHFYSDFPDGTGVMSLTQGGAGFGMGSKKFVEYNSGEFFYPGYVIHYCDVELSHRAILMGKYSWMYGDFFRYRREFKEGASCLDSGIRYEMIRKDRILYSKRKDHKFYIPKEKIFNPDHDFLQFEKCLVGVNNDRNKI